MKFIPANELITKLDLLQHPEGGYYRELYRSDEIILKNGLPERYTGDRSFSTAIYFLLTVKDVSKFHRIKSDELWHFYMGDPLDIYMITQEGKMEVRKLGIDLEDGQSPQILIPKGCWFGAKTTGSTYSLLGCTVAPGFDFEDFELANRDFLINTFTEHTKTIIKFT